MNKGVPQGSGVPQGDGAARGSGLPRLDRAADQFFGELPAGVLSDVAGADPVVRLALRRKFGAAAAIISAGLVMLILSAVLSSLTANDTDQLAANGSTSYGTVDQVQPATGDHKSKVQVTYEALGKTYTGTRTVPSDGRYHVGLLLLVHYNAKSPQHFALDGESADESSTSFVELMLAVLGVGVLAFGGFRGAQAFGLRSTLNSARWQKVLIDRDEYGMRDWITTRVRFIDETGQLDGRFETFEQHNKGPLIGGTRMSPPPPVRGVGLGVGSPYRPPQPGLFATGPGDRGVVAVGTRSGLQLVQLRRPKSFIDPTTSGLGEGR